MPVDVRPVANGRELRAFISLPEELYRGEPRWAPPLRLERRQFLDRRRNPFFAHAAAEYFLAWRDGRPVGRISAHVDERLNTFQKNTWGLFGFFETVDDPEVATALLDHAEAWLCERGRDRMVGPMDFTTNHDLGVLVEGFERPAIFLAPWTHPYYPALLEGAGLTKAQDLLMWEIGIEDRPAVAPAIWEVADRVEREHGITVRTIRKRNLAAEVTSFLEVYNAAWHANWSFVPLTEAEVREYAKRLRPILREEWAFIAEHQGEVIGAALALPDYNQVLRAIGGRLLPFGWARALRARRRVDRARIFALGVRPEYQDLGAGALLYRDFWEAAERAYRETAFKHAEMGWVLESNTDMNRALEGLGGHLSRRWRVYERTFADGPSSGPPPLDE
jgi:GNAT superfamily N-acetyltransferase